MDKGDKLSASFETTKLERLFLLSYHCSGDPVLKLDAERPKKLKF
jgi:hypothetical protein